MTMTNTQFTISISITAIAALGHSAAGGSSGGTRGNDGGPGPASLHAFSSDAWSSRAT